MHASETLPIVQTAHSSSLVHPPIYNLHKTYVDPHTYEDPQVLLTNCCTADPACNVSNVVH